jgi:hypothetical protein
MPIHVSYLIYLGILSSTLPSIYLKTALTLCRLTGTQPSLLLHPLDFLGCDEDRDLSFFPGMGLPLKRKLQVVSDSLEIFCSRFVPVTLQQHAREINLNANLRIVSPKFDDSKRKHVPDLQMIE